MEPSKYRSASPEIPLRRSPPPFQNQQPVIGARRLRVGSANAGPNFPAPTTNLPIYGELRNAPPVVHHGAFRAATIRQPLPPGAQPDPMDVIRRAHIADNTDRLTELVASLSHNLRIRAAYLDHAVESMSYRFDPNYEFSVISTGMSERRLLDFHASYHQIMELFLNPADLGGFPNPVWQMIPGYYAPPPYYVPSHQQGPPPGSPGAGNSGGSSGS